jgi:hypothetical protein
MLLFEYKEEGVPATRLQVGPEIAGVSDEQIVELHNERLRAQAKLAAEYKHVAVEVPLGSRRSSSGECADKSLDDCSTLKSEKTDGERGF